MARNPKKKKGRKATGPQTGTVSAVEPSVQSSASQPRPQVWQPGVNNLAEGEELQFDPSAYDCLHAFQLGWPCLSFDLARDALGVLRNEFPHTLYFCAGTQADKKPNNALVIGKASNITGVRRGPKHATPMDEDGSESESDSSSDDEESPPNAEHSSSKKPYLQSRMVAHQGCVNRVRVMPQQSHIVATWSDSGYVQVWDTGNHVRALSAGVAQDSSTLQANVLREAPLQIFTGHKDEGFALDWSPFSPGRLLSGDCRRNIHLWEPTSSGKWNVGAAPFLGHTSSVEDLQWSPTQADVFASCSTDKTLRIWDSRDRLKSKISIIAHDDDINVISWNRLASCLIASGCDDGTFRIWDLRKFEKSDDFVAHFKYHNAAITSIEWNPNESSTLAVTSEDNQLTIWDFSLERDEEEEAEYQAQLKIQQAAAPTDLPPQLLFVHLGQKNLKEVHWHPQIQCLLISTGADGFNILRPSNLENLPAAA